MSNVLRPLALCLLLMAGGSSQADAQTAPQQNANQQNLQQGPGRNAASPPGKQAAPSAEEAIKDRRNKGTVGIATGQLDAAYPSLAQDMAKVLDDGDNLRVIPMITYGSVGNIEDLLYLRNVDIAFTKADNFVHFKQNLNINLQNRIHYITRLFDAELHVLVRPEIQSWEDLRGKKVNIGVVGNAAHTTVPIVQKALGIEFEVLMLDHAIGIEMMKKGEISAAMRVGGKPMSTFTKVPAGSGFRFLPISVSDFAAKFSDIYVLGKLTEKDYPTIIPAGEEITTIAVPDILAVYNWPKNTDRYQRVEKFVTAFFTKFKDLQKEPFHAKWKDVNLAATIPGWTRSEIAERMLQQTAEAPADAKPGDNAYLAQRKPVSAAKSTGETEALFREFLKSRKQGQ
jgi:TRAP transporter TAXI family solute receptor